MEIEIDWEWFNMYGIDNRKTNKFHYENIYDASQWHILQLFPIRLCSTIPSDEEVADKQDSAMQGVNDNRLLSIESRTRPLTRLEFIINKL